MTFRLRCGVVLGGLFSIAALGQTTEEYRVKAAFLFNLAKFVEWPSQSFKSPADPIAICILGRNPFGDALHQAVAGKVVQGRALSVLQVGEGVQASACNILFVSGSEHKRMRSILSDIKSTGVLTVGEIEGFTEEGGIMNFKIEGGNVRFQINAAEASRQQLQISSKLLSLAEIVRK
jgi:hypothetical protein